MAIPKEYREEAFYWILNNTGLSETESRRFVNNASKTDKKCPICRGNHDVYVLSEMEIKNSTGEVLLLSIFTAGLYYIIWIFQSIGAKKIYFCLDCPNMWD